MQPTVVWGGLSRHNFTLFLITHTVLFFFFCNTPPFGQRHGESSCDGSTRARGAVRQQSGYSGRVGQRESSKVPATVVTSTTDRVPYCLRAPGVWRTPQGACSAITAVGIDHVQRMTRGGRMGSIARTLRRVLSLRLRCHEDLCLHLFVTSSLANRTHGVALTRQRLQGYAGVGWIPWYFSPEFRAVMFRSSLLSKYWVE